MQNRFLHVTGRARINQALNTNGCLYALSLSLDTPSSPTACPTECLFLPGFTFPNVSGNDQVQIGPSWSFTSILGPSLSQPGLGSALKA